jgi:histidyl-tRNA synthetase
MLSTLENYNIIDNYPTFADKTYHFLDKSNRRLLLSPDSQIATLKYVLNNFNLVNNYYSIHKIFRYRNKKYRQFHHLCIESIYKNENINDLELLEFL